MIDPDTLLCERCGYPIGDLPAAGSCPECGTLITESLPERRTGTGSLAWRVLLLRIVNHPRSVFAQIAIDRPASDLLLARNLSTASLILTLGITGSTILLAFAADLPIWLWVLTILSLSVIYPWIYILHYLLTAIERRGVRFFGRARGWRITPDVAHAVVAHASFCWCIGALATAATMQVCVVAYLLAGPVLPFSFIAAPVLVWLVGLVYFETLVYIGIRRCRFANRPRRQAGTALPPDGRGSPAA